MKKILALTLALLMVVGMFAACGDNSGSANNDNKASEPAATDAPTEPNATEPPATDAPTESDPTEVESNVITASTLSNHENGWEVEAWNEDAAGIYFNMWTNDLPYNTDWSLRYQAHSSEVVRLVRDGEVYPIGGPGIGQLVKYGANGYYLSFDKWITQELFPLQEGDVIILEGDFSNPENGYTIHFDKSYIQLKVGGITKFTTKAPEGITE